MGKSSVNVNRKDGGLGLTASVGQGTHIKIGVCTTGQANRLIALADPDDVAEKLGFGPLARACYDSMQLGARSIIAVPASASQAGSTTAVTRTGTGTATYALSGSPNDDYEVILRIVKGGTVNEAQYEVSVDGGDNFSPKKTIPTNGAVPIGDTGMTITFTPNATDPETSFVEGDEYRWKAKAPQMTQADFLAAMEAVKANIRVQFEFIHVVGASSVPLWAAGAAEATMIESQYKKPIFFIFEARGPAEDETTDEWVSALITERGSFASPDVCVVAGRLEISGLDKTVRDTNGAGVFSGIRVQRHPGYFLGA